MNARLDLQAIAAHIRTSAAAISGLHVGTGNDHGYQADFVKKWPAVWIGAQRLVRQDDGRGYSEYGRQRMKCEIALRLVVQRHAKGQTSGESALDTLHNATVAALFGHHAAGTDEPFVLESTTDGDQTETLMSADLVFSAPVTYTGPTP